jgi:hypothetical protein
LFSGFGQFAGFDRDGPAWKTGFEHLAKVVLIHIGAREGLASDPVTA